MKRIYYIELNLICIIVNLIVWKMGYGKSKTKSSEQITFIEIVFATIVTCVSDMAAGCLNGCSFKGCGVLLEIFNIVYFEAIAVIAFEWMVLVRLKLGNPITGKKLQIWAIPVAAFTILAITNPFTDILFSLNEHNVYSRGFGVYIHWAVTWLYMLVTTGMVIVAAAREKTKAKKKEKLTLALFIVAPIVAGLAQMLVYGVSSAQVGLTISIWLIYLLRINELVLTDSLTGLNNRRDLENYLNDYLVKNKDLSLTIVMMDLNDFKKINDNFGHLAGDLALAETADALKTACSHIQSRLFICRYAGDEFVIAGIGRGEEETEQLKRIIYQEVSKKDCGGRVQLGISIGIATAQCADYSAIEELIRRADKAMYEDKKRQGTGR